jgi:predicted RNA binding protein YcfA (HicA-like mRNA interferase family)
MPRKTKDVCENLLKKGFTQRNGGDKYFHLFVDGKKTPVFTFVSHGAKEIHDGLLGQMAKQTKLVKKEFLDLVDCPMTEPQYLGLLRERGHIARAKDSAEDAPG